MTAVVGCLGVVAIVVIGPWVGCAACAFCVSVAPTPHPAATHHPIHR